MKKISKIFCLLLTVCLGLMAVAGCAIFSSETTLKDGQVGVEYSDSIAAGSRDMFYDLDYDSSLPKGLTLWGDGAITGIPMEAGTFEFTAVAINTNDEEFTAEFSMTIAGAELSYTATALPDATTGEPYQQNIGTATGMPEITYSVKEGSTLPAGLALSAEGILSGRPTEAVESASFTVVASASGCDPVEAMFTLKVLQGEDADETLGYIKFEDFTLPEGLVGEAYSQDIFRAEGVPGITYSVRFTSGKGLPQGLAYDSELGLISGTPTDSTHGPITFRVTAKAEGYDSVTVMVTLNVMDVYVATGKLEAEYIYVNDLSGAGYSSAPSGTGLIQSAPGASNGFFLGYLNKAMSFSFEFTATQATSAKLTLHLGSEVGNFTYDPSMFAITVNGEELDYGSFDVKQIGTSVSDFGFTAIELSPSVNLVQGDNVITFEIFNSDKATGTFNAVGCLFDCIEFKGYGGEIGWRPKVANVAGK